jgi:hypothetical protein
MSPSWAMNRIPFPSRVPTLCARDGPGSLRDHPSEERRLHRADDEPVAGRLVQEVNDVLVLLGGQLLELGGTADPDQEEDLPDVRPPALDQPGDVRQLPDVAAHDGGVDLHGVLLAHQQSHGRARGTEVFLDPPNPLVRRGPRAVEADRDGFGPGLAHPSGGLLGQERGDAGREPDRQSERASVPGELEQVFPHERIAAREHEDGWPRREAREVVDQPQTLLGRELTRERLRDRLGPAMPTGEPTGPRRLPEEQDRRPVEVHGGPGRGERLGHQDRPVPTASRFAATRRSASPVACRTQSGIPAPR